MHVDGARRIARIAREMGVERLVHVGALNSTPDPEPALVPYNKKGCQFLKSKYYGEKAVREEFPDAIIFRPADMFGHQDRFSTYFIHVWRRQFHRVPLWKMGRGIFKQPIYVGDVGRAIAKSIFTDEAPGATYDCLGPKRYELIDFVRYLNQCVQKDDQFGYYIKDMRFTPFFLLRVYIHSRFRAVYPPVCIDKLEKVMQFKQSHLCAFYNDLVELAT